MLFLSAQYVLKAQILTKEISEQERIFNFSKVWSEIKYNFVNMDKINFDIDSLYNAYIPEMLKAPTDYDYYRVMERFVTCFNDGHTELAYNSYWPHDLMDYFPCNISDFNKKIYITTVRKNIPGVDTTWLGAEIVEIDGLPAEKYLRDSIFPYVSASTEQHKWMQGVYKIAYHYKTKPFNAKIRKRNNDIEEISVKRNGETIRTENDTYAGPVPNYGEATVSFKFLEDSIGILTVNRFYPDEEIISEINKSLPEIYKAKKLIIDLRRNGGGSTACARYLQSLLTPEYSDSILNYAWETRVNNGVGKANGNWIEEYKDYYNNRALEFHEPRVYHIADSIRRIKCPLVILASRFTFSAAEDFLVNIYEAPDRPVIIGEPTGGSTGSPLVVPLTGKTYLRVCTRRICYPYSFKRLVNEGVIPDIIVKQNINDYLAEKDIVLEKALEYLK
jgi:C-terminal processing protease CtpA/Prc